MQCKNGIKSMRNVLLFISNDYNNTHKITHIVKVIQYIIIGTVYILRFLFCLCCIEIIVFNFFLNYRLYILWCTSAIHKRYKLCHDGFILYSTYHFLINVHCYYIFFVITPCYILLLLFNFV